MDWVVIDRTTQGMWKTDIGGERSFMTQPALVARTAKDKTYESKKVTHTVAIIIIIINVYTLVSRHKTVTSHAAMVTEYRGQCQSQVKKSLS